MFISSVVLDNAQKNVQSLRILRITFYYQKKAGES